MREIQGHLKLGSRSVLKGKLIASIEKMRKSNNEASVKMKQSKMKISK